MAYYTTCQLCGANLDPGERCDCMKKPGLLTTATGLSRTTKSNFGFCTQGQPQYTTREPFTQEGGFFMAKQDMREELAELIMSMTAEEITKLMRSLPEALKAGDAAV